jgi:hypothetical protein
VTAGSISFFIHMHVMLPTICTPPSLLFSSIAFYISIVVLVAIKKVKKKVKLKVKQELKLNIRKNAKRSEIKIKSE